MVMRFYYVRKVALCAFAAIAGMVLSACSDGNDEFATVDGLAPTFEPADATILTEPGRAFTISGLAGDADGLKSIRLVNSGLSLDKTIDFLEYYPDTLLHEYKLNYTYAGKEEWTGNETFPIEITVEDVGGRKTTKTVTVSTGGDFSAPTFTSAPSANLTVLLQNPKLSLNAAVADNKSLDYILVSIPALDISDKIEVTGTAYRLSRSYTLPEKEASYEMTLTVADGAGNTASAVSTIKVSDLPDFDRMYLADVTDVADLTSDLYGVPMLIEHTGPYQYRAHYYNKVAGTPIRFIPQKTDFQPICFVVDANTGLLTSDPSAGDPIVLDQVGYVEITFNSANGEWDVRPWKPTTPSMVLDGSATVDFKDGSGAQPAQICLAGNGLPDAPNWNTNPNDGAYIVMQDAENPYRLYREMTLTKGTAVEFTISQTHWWGWWPSPYWRFDGSAENEANVLNGGDNMKKVTVPATGKYLFEFDYALLRSRIIPVK